MRKILDNVFSVVVPAIVGVVLVVGLFLTDGTETATYIDQELFYQETDLERIRTDAESGISYAQGEILVSFEKSIEKKEAEVVAKKHGAKLIGMIADVGECQWQFTGDESLEKLEEKAENLIGQDGITSAMVNYVREMEAEGDYSEDNQEMEELIHADRARELFKTQIENRKVVPADVGVIDTWLYSEHKDLEFARVYFGVDNDKLKEKVERNYEDKNDRFFQLSHGTHVAGILGATCDNHEGIDGMYPLAPYHMYGVGMSAARSETRRGNSFTDEVCLELLFRQGVKLINYSMGYKDVDDIKEGDLEFVKKLSNYYGSFLQKCLDNGRDFLIVNAAGNDQGEIDARWSNVYAGISEEKYPSVYRRILVVGACDEKAELAKLSNRGDRVDLVAPGEGILSTCPIGYYSMEGTSQATPYVTGTAAMVWTLLPDLSGDEVKEWLVSSGTETEENYQLLDAGEAVGWCAQLLTPGKIDASETNDEGKSGIKIPIYESEDIREILEVYYQKTLIPQFGCITTIPVRVDTPYRQNTTQTNEMTEFIQETGETVSKATYLAKLRGVSEGIVGYRIDDFDRDSRPELVVMRTEIQDYEEKEHLRCCLEVYEYDIFKAQVVLRDIVFQEGKDCIDLMKYSQLQIGLFQQNIEEIPYLIWGVDAIGNKEKWEDTCRVYVMRYRGGRFSFELPCGYGNWGEYDASNGKPGVDPQKKDGLYVDAEYYYGDVYPLEKLAQWGLISKKLSSGRGVGLTEKVIQGEKGRETLRYFSPHFQNCFEEKKGEGFEHYDIGELTVNQPILEYSERKVFDIQGCEKENSEKSDIPDKEPTEAETDETASDDEDFEYLTRPWIHLPRDLFAGGAYANPDGWPGIYYAEGVGLEMDLYENQESGEYYATIYDYNSEKMLFSREMKSDGKNALKAVDDGFRLSGFDGTNLQFELLTKLEGYTTEEAQYVKELYREVATAEFTEVNELMAHAGQDHWGGAYQMQRDEETEYISLVPLFGTGDYLMVRQFEENGQQIERYNWLFLTKEGESLNHEYTGEAGPGAWTAVYQKDRSGNLTYYDHDTGETDIYTRYASHPMWKEYETSQVPSGTGRALP